MVLGIVRGGDPDQGQGAGVKVGTAGGGQDLKAGTGNGVAEGVAPTASPNRTVGQRARVVLLPPSLAVGLKVPVKKQLMVPAASAPNLARDQGLKVLQIKTIQCDRQL